MLALYSAAGGNARRTREAIRLRGWWGGVLILFLEVLVGSSPVGAQDLVIPIESVDPSSGPTAGGVVVSILASSDCTAPSNACFLDGAQVTFGGSPASQVIFVDDMRLDATAPANAAGFVDVIVTNPDEDWGILLNAYEYVEATPVPSLTGWGILGASLLLLGGGTHLLVGPARTCRASTQTNSPQ